MTIKVVYLAARYSRNAEMRQYRDELAEHGIIVSSRWIDQHGGNVLESFVAEKLNSEPEYCSKYALVDLDDLAAADTVINFTGLSGGGKGGRHWEMGWAYAARKRQFLVGSRENVFHTLPDVIHYNTWDDFVNEKLITNR